MSGPSSRLASWIDIALPRVTRSPEPHVIGVFEGEGIGPEVVGAALDVLLAVSQVCSLPLDVVRGGPIGDAAERALGATLPDAAIALCEAVFARGGAILQGPGGGRFVYELRRRFDLFLKIVPLVARPVIARASRFKAEHLAGVDILLVRDNAGGVYQGTWDERLTPQGRVATHTFTYDERQVRAIVGAAARLAAARRGELLVAVKEGGVPSVSRLWRDVAHDEGASHGLAVTIANVDLVAYRMVQCPTSIDVLVTPNLVGDVLADLGAVLEGSRGVSYSGNFTPAGLGVFQTNHGAAHDLAGGDRANPVGQILSAAMLVREALGRPDAAALMERAVEDVWADGVTTDDLPLPGARAVGCRELAGRIADRVVTLGRAGR